MALICNYTDLWKKWNIQIGKNEAAGDQYFSGGLKQRENRGVGIQALLLEERNMKHAQAVQRGHLQAPQSNTKDLILHRVKKACRKHGFVEIGEGYVCVDTEFYKVKPR